ncbi:MAG: hypothetical protein ACYCX7_00445 [Solirubrobacteraceae bacterium]
MSAPDASKPAPAARTVMVRLHPDTEERIALRVAALLLRRLKPPQSSPKAQELLSASELASRYRLHRGWVYEHADELGAIRIGNGSRPRLRFDAEHVARYLRIPESPKRKDIAGNPRPIRLASPRRES